MGDYGSTESQTLDVDVLIVGAGPTGASLGSFLGSHGKACHLTYFRLMQHCAKSMLTGVTTWKGSQGCRSTLSLARRRARVPIT